MSGDGRLISCFYADDFTGAADVLLQYARAGLRARLIVDPHRIGEAADADEGLDVLGVAGVARALPRESIAGEVGPVLDSFLSLEPRLVQYKICSTFDSSYERGSIGRACEVARERFGDRRIPVLAAQPELGRYTIFSNHFARTGDGVVYRLDEHPSMSVHPVTPARDANLVRVLAAQAPGLDVGALDVVELRSGQTGDLAAGEGDVVVIDALESSDLLRAGRMIWSHAAGAGDRTVFAVGSGGLSHGIAAQLPGAVAPTTGALAPVGAMLALAGSASPHTRRQIDVAARAGWETFELGWDPSDTSAGGELDACVVAAIAGGRSVVVHTPAGVAAGEASASEAIGAALARLLRTATAETRLRRVLVAGGDTCGSVFRRLDVEAFDLIGAVSDVPLCRATSRAPALDGIEVALKGGQIGAVDLFDRTRAGEGVALR